MIVSGNLQPTPLVTPLMNFRQPTLATILNQPPWQILVVFLRNLLHVQILSLLGVICDSWLIFSNSWSWSVHIVFYLIKCQGHVFK